METFFGNQKVVKQTDYYFFFLSQVLMQIQDFLQQENASSLKEKSLFYI